MGVMQGKLRKTTKNTAKGSLYPAMSKTFDFVGFFVKSIWDSRLCIHGEETRYELFF